MEIFLCDMIILTGNAKDLLSYPQRVMRILRTVTTQPIQNIRSPTQQPTTHRKCPPKIWILGIYRFQKNMTLTLLDSNLKEFQHLEYQLFYGQSFFSFLL